MRVLVVGSRNFHAGYRVDRALLRASRDQDDITLITLGDRTRRGADSMARDMADGFGWRLDRSPNVSQARADLCLAFLHAEDAYDDRARISALKAEKAGIPVWRYYEGGPRRRHDVMTVDDFDPDIELTQVEVGIPEWTFDFDGTRYRIRLAEAA